VTYVRPERTAAKRKAAKKVAASKPASTNGGAHAAGTFSTATAVALSSVEDLLRAVAPELGLGRAIEILAGERARVRAAIGA
jgi:hypothetical protein